MRAIHFLSIASAACMKAINGLGIDTAATGGETIQAGVLVVWVLRFGVYN